MAQASYTHVQQETVLWHTTELITPEDLNFQQRLKDRRLLDHLLAGLLEEPGSDTDDDAAIAARPIGDGFGIYQMSPADMTVRVLPGTLLWKQAADPMVAEPTQPAPRVLWHRMDSVLSVVVDAAHATLGRIDILSYKLEYDPEDTLAGPDFVTRVIKNSNGTFSAQDFDKRRRTLLTITYTPGTASGSPAAPATPSGHVKFAEISVPATDTAISQTQISDFRTPAGCTTIAFPVGAAHPTSGWTMDFHKWLSSSADEGLHCSAAHSSMVSKRRALPGTSGKVAGRHLRLKTLYLGGKFTLAGDGAANLWRTGLSTGGTSTLVADLDALGLASASDALHTIDFSSLALWANGFPNPSTNNLAERFAELKLIIVSGAANDFFRGASAVFWGQ